MEKKKIKDSDVRKALKRSKDDKISDVSKDFGMKYLNFNISRSSLEKNLKKNLVETKFIVDLLKECVDFHKFLLENKNQLMKENVKLQESHFEKVTNMLEQHINWCNQNLNIAEQVKKIQKGFYEYEKTKKVRR